MIPRGKLYISTRDIVSGMYFCLTDRFSSPNANQDTDKLICLSVRTGFDLALEVLNFAPGSEILVTDINIPDMFGIIERHNLTSIPIPVNKHTLNISARTIEAAITPLTKAILITHVFGGVSETDKIIAVAKKHNLIVFEDCAQAYAGNLYDGNPESDVVMFSFGFIKTNTAIKGAVIKIRNPVLYAAVVLRNGTYKRQDTIGYLKKLFQVAFFKMLMSKLVYTAFYKIMIAKGKDFDKVLSGFIKSFPGEKIFEQIRYRPCRPNEQLLQKKLKNFNQNDITKRVQLANDILQNIPDSYKVGLKNRKHTHWVMPVETNDPNGLVEYLRKNGFDASQKASSMVQLKKTHPPCPEDLILEKLVYLPGYSQMSAKECEKLTALLIAY
ncbi:MAG: DegT/DnrJ/EryC1/StrS family aminotransferase [Pedobacter sp.]